MFAIPAIGVPSGVIVVWRKSIADIPSGWHLCDGTYDTEDLRDRMIVCAGHNYDVDNLGGATTHNHIFTPALHRHTMEDGQDIMEGDTFSKETDDSAGSGSVNTINHLPPYYAKAFIQKL